jgi:hypothetical protein
MAELQKILIAEVSDNKTWYNWWPYSQNTWFVRTNNVYTDFADSDYELEKIGLESDFTVLSLQVQKVDYSKVTTIANVIANEKSWYFDLSTRTLIVHFEDHKPYYYFKTTDIEIGFVLGFYSTNGATRGVWNEQQYYPRLLSPTVFGDKKDDQYFAKQVFPAANVRIDNNDLFFKNFAIGSDAEDRIGNFVRTLVWTGADSTTALYSEFVVTYQGIIETIKEGKEIDLKLRDLRANLQVKSPFNYLDTTSFTYIKNPDKEHTLPQLWGKCDDVPVLCLNENVNKNVTWSSPIGPFSPTPTDYIFLICDTSQHTIATDSVKTVYIDGVETIINPGTVSFDSQEFAYFTISETEFRENGIDSSGVITSIKWQRMDKVTVDVWGYLKGTDFKESDGSTTSNPTDLIENGLAVLREVLKNNYGWDYISVLYDITTWQTFEDAAYDVNYYLNKPISTQKQIEELSTSQLGKFIWGPDKLFSFDNDDFDGYQTDIIKNESFPLNYFPEFTKDAREVLSIFRVGYKRKWKQTESELKYEWNIDSSNQDTALSVYNSTFEKDFPTLISNLTDAQAYATRLLVFGGISIDTFTINCNWDKYNLKAGEWLRVQGDYSNGEYVGWTKCQIQEIKPNINNWTVTLKLRIFSYIGLLTFDGELALLDGSTVLIED